MPITTLASCAHRGRRLRVLALAAGIVVVVHAWLLLHLVQDMEPVASPGPAAAMTLLALRGGASVPIAPAIAPKAQAAGPVLAAGPNGPNSPPGPAEPAPVAVPSLPNLPAAVAVPRRAVPPRAMPGASIVAAATAPAGVSPEPAAAAPPTLAAEATAAMPEAAAGVEWPVYATRLPPSMRLHYRLRRGDSLGSATLHWQIDPEGYRLSIDGELNGKPTLGSTSRGGVDAAGIAPLRHAERRRSREVRAVNFQREAGLISFSGPQVQYALRPGAQDRSSWIVQLPAIVEAQPALGERGVTLFVAGTRGDAEAWHFEPRGREDVVGVTQALHLQREPRRPYDSRVEVWLDPARGHLPVRLRFTAVPGGVPLEMELEAVEPGA